MSFVSSVTKDILSIWFNKHTEEGERIAEVAIQSAQQRAKASKTVERKKTFICANPDEVVSRGNQIEFCAGSLAKYYKKLGGRVLYFGKPYEEIYKFAKLTIEKNCEKYVEKKKILAVGDNLKTDIHGAQNFNIDSLLILNGIYKDFFRDNNLNFDKLLKSNEMESLKINKFQQELNW